MAEDGKLDEVAIRLGEGLRAARGVAGVTQAELARRLGVPPNYVNRWEAGGHRLKIETIRDAEEAMKVPAGTVFRFAGYVDDGKLIDLGTLRPGARLSIEAILQAYDGITDDGFSSS